MLRKDLPIRNNLTDGTIAGYSGTITVLENSIISPVRNNLGGPAGGVILPPPPTEAYPASQVNRYVPGSINAGATLWTDELNAYNFTLYNCTKSGNELVFNGASSWAETGIGVFLIPATANFSVSAYFKPTNFSATRATYSQVGTTTASIGRLLSYTASPSTVAIDIYDATGSGGTPVFLRPTGYTAGGYFYTTITRNGNDFKYYVNGVLAASQTLASVSVAQQRTRLGRYDDTFPLYFLGNYKYFGICNQALTQEEIDLEYAKVLTL